MDQQAFVRENREQSVLAAQRQYALDNPYVVHYLSLRAYRAQVKPEMARFATLGEAEQFAQRIVDDMGTAAASVWEEKVLRWHGGHVPEARDVD